MKPEILKFELKEITGSYKSCFAENTSFDDKIKIHFIEKNDKKKDQLSIVFSPGVWEPAERAIPLFDGLDYHCISISYRGRGKSDTPAIGYDLKHHVSDLQTVIDAAEIKSFILVAFSRGVGYACGYAEKFPGKIKGMIFVDHPPIHIKPWEGYAEYWKNLIYLGNPVTKSIHPDALDGLQKEAQEFEFWDLMKKLEIPILILRGISNRSKIKSELSESDIEKYKACVKNLKVIDFEYSGHMIVDEELGKYRAVVNDFCNIIRNCLHESAK
jgi:pimeloyl-ACP methyl ester carboxylesterase